MSNLAGFECRLSFFLFKILEAYINYVESILRRKNDKMCQIPVRVLSLCELALFAGLFEAELLAFFFAWITAE